ncbi:MAG: glucosaminidase domain-containing protein [Eubacteriales bacterium]|nr:glucosaminidase domain-containing protein [Eubacteriales bacterium]
MRMKRKCRRVILPLLIAVMALSIGFGKKDAYAYADYPIMGESSVTAEQLAAFYNSRAEYPSYYKEHGADAPTIDDLAQIYVEEATAEGVRPEVAFCQMCLETGYLSYSGDSKIEQYNFAGIGTTGGGVKGNYFETMRLGVRAQVQHLKAYASTGDLTKECVDPRFHLVARGIAPNLSDLDGRWAAANGYGDHIYVLIDAVLGMGGSRTDADMFRLYNPNSGEHFYTQNYTERISLVEKGWSYEGIGWRAPLSGDPVYRLYNPNAGDHHYTTSADERDMLTAKGWSYEGIGWYSDTNKGTALYRAYNPNAEAGAHNYTTSKSEQNYLVSVGWKDEGLAWYGVK